MFAIVMSVLTPYIYGECRAAKAEWHSVCAVSGTVPEEPVISTRSGHLYEKRLVEKHIKVCTC